MSIKNIWLPLWLVLLWMILWGNASALTIIGGVIVMLIVLAVFRLPSIAVTDRFDSFYTLYAFIWFLKELVMASLRVTVVALTKGSHVKNAILGVKLLPTSPMTTTVASHFVTLVPGSSVIDIDFTNHIMYIHALNVENESDMQKIRDETVNIHHKTMRCIGTKADMQLLKQEEK
ncbi:MAG: Na+/H+ antiporter subunit E [Micrococcaceae bacterium]